MDEDCSPMLDFYLAHETKTTLFDCVWPDEYILSTNNSKMTDENDERDIQDLFDDKTNTEVDKDDDNKPSRSWGEGPRSGDVKEITDQEIANLSVQELNKRLRNVPWDEVKRIRKRRRNLKNRSYSLSCRLRKLQERKDLINENTSLKKQLNDGKWKLLKMWKEKEAYKKKYLQVQKWFTVRNQRRKIPESPPRR